MSNICRIIHVVKQGALSRYARGPWVATPDSDASKHRSDRSASRSLHVWMLQQNDAQRWQNASANNTVSRYPIRSYSNFDGGNDDCHNDRCRHDEHDERYRYQDGKERDRYDDSGPESEWQQWMRSYTRDAWSLNQPCHFVEAVAWGTAVIVGLQYTHVRHCGRQRRRTCHDGQGGDTSPCPAVRLHDAAVFAIPQCIWPLFIWSSVTKRVLPALRSVGLMPGRTDSGDEVDGAFGGNITEDNSEIESDSYRSSSNEGTQKVTEQRIHDPGGQWLPVGALWSHRYQCRPLDGLARVLRSSKEKFGEDETDYGFESAGASPNFEGVTTGESITDGVPSVDDLTETSSDSSEVDSAVNALQQLDRRWRLAGRDNVIAARRADSDISGAVRLWSRAVKRGGYARAAYNLGICYESGRGVDVDVDKAMQYYQLAADQGHICAMYNLAILHLRRSTTDKPRQDGVDAGIQSTVQDNLCGDGLRSGTGVDDVLTGRHGMGDSAASVDSSGGASDVDDMEVAIELLQQASDNGLVQAHRELGVLYAEDSPRQDLAKAALLFQRGAKQKDAWCQFYLGVCYERGLGVVKNEAHAAELYRQAATADRGPTEARFNLAMFFEQGLGGLPRNKRAALELYEKAQEAGNKMAAQRVRLIRDQLGMNTDMWEVNGTAVNQTVGVQREQRASSSYQRSINWTAAECEANYATVASATTNAMVATQRTDTKVDICGVKQLASGSEMNNAQFPTTLDELLSDGERSTLHNKQSSPQDLSKDHCMSGTLSLVSFVTRMNFHIFNECSFSGAGEPVTISSNEGRNPPHKTTTCDGLDRQKVETDGGIAHSHPASFADLFSLYRSGKQGGHFAADGSPFPASRRKNVLGQSLKWVKVEPERPERKIPSGPSHVDSVLYAGLPAGGCFSSSAVRTVAKFK